MDGKKVERLLSVIFSVIGSLIIITGIFVQIANNAFLKTAMETSATITNIDKHRDSDGDIHYYPEVEFFVNGKRYGGRLGEYNSSMRVGGKTTIYYNPDNPANFRSGSAPIIGYLLMGFGLIFFLIGAGFIFFSIRKRTRMKYLLDNGRRVMAVIDSVGVNYSYRVNRRHPFLINCSYVDPATGKVFTFVSDNIWFNVNAVLNNNSISTIPVYIDENNPSRYYVDLEPLKAYLGN